MTSPTLFLGARAGQDPTAEASRVAPEASDFTTHGVIVGMTGSGKTGLGVVLLEEVLRQGIPALIIDPKGDMGNLALRFPQLDPAQFEPWVEASDTNATDKAQAVATLWRDGLSKWGHGPPQLEALAERSLVEIYTPGSRAGIGLNVLGSLEAPTANWDTEAEALLAEIAAFVSGLLGLIGVDADPLASREYILLTNLVQAAWQKGRALDLPTLIAEIQKPPMRKLGVFELEQFFPAKDRMQLAMRINGLVANPSFATWLEGAPLSIESMLHAPDGRAKASVIYLAHLNDEQRQFVVTLLLSKVVTWMRNQPGTSSLRALIYMDEVFGFAPPSANPPSKTPILTILKQARAHGVGMVLSTQNPVDLDYKAMSNAGTWMIGRLQTERDKARILEGLRSASGDVDVAALDTQIGELGKRQFVFHSTRSKAPSVFSTRWAMSYLRGPLTLEEVTRLRPATRPVQAAPSPASASIEAPSPAAESKPAVESPAAEDESPVEPKIADGTRSRYLDPASPLVKLLDVDPAGKRLEVGLAVRVSLTFDERKADLDHREEWEAVYFPVTDPFEASTRHTIDHDPRDFEDQAPANARFATPRAPVHTKGFMSKAQREIKAQLYREETLQLFRNATLKLYSRVDESESEFKTRCAAAAEDRADTAVAKLHDKAARKLATLEKRMQTAQRQLDRAQTAAQTASQSEVVSGVGAVLGAIFGSRSASSIAGKAGGLASRRGRTTRSKQRVAEAEDKIESVTEDVEDLEADTLAAVEELRQEWASKAEDVEPFEVGLEKADISVDDIVAVWIPISR